MRLVPHLTLAGNTECPQAMAILEVPRPPPTDLDLNSPYIPSRFYLACVVLGLQFLHEKKIIYR